MGSSTPQGQPWTSRLPPTAVLPSVLRDAVGALIARFRSSQLRDTQPTYTPAQRFKCDLTIALAWLGARMVRYSWPVTSSLNDERSRGGRRELVAQFFGLCR